MDLSNLPQYLMAVLGIGLVIFVHEAGHFLAARWCKVRVHVFSLGFGPRLFGWRRGHTTYQIAAIPLGGYVRMAGDEGAAQGRAPEPWELQAKSVPQRFLIYSGGVLMNVAFGILVFPALYLAGIPSIEPVIGAVEGGSPAWMAGVEPGTRVLEVNGREIYDLDMLPQEVAYNGDAPVELVVVAPGAQAPSTLVLEPEKDERQGIYSIGRVGPTHAQGHPLGIAPDGAAAAAGLRDGDHLLGVVGQPAELAPERQLARALRDEETITLAVERDGQRVEADVTPREAAGESSVLLGVQPLGNLVKAVRPTPRTAGLDLREGDRVLAIDGRTILERDDVLDALLASPGPHAWRVERDEREHAFQSPALSTADALALRDELAFDNDMDGTRVIVLQRSAAERAGLVSGDRIERLDGSAVTSYAEVRAAAGQAARHDRSLRVDYTRQDAEGATTGEVEVRPAAWSPMDYGLGVEVARYDYRVTDGWKALRLGVSSCVDMLRDVWRTLRGVLTREVSEDNIGGIITIGVLAKHTASLGLVKFFWFLCVLSLNLAFLNVLPIPLLDGGHLFFLLIEGVKGSPVSERILSYSQLVGLVLIVSVFVFVIYNDLTLHVFN